MTAVFAAVLTVGLVVLVVWFLLVAGDRGATPQTEQAIVLGMTVAVAFGMAGMSASFAGWNALASSAVAVIAAVAGVGYVSWLRGGRM